MAMQRRQNHPVRFGRSWWYEAVSFADHAPESRSARLRRCVEQMLCLINLISCAFLSDVAKVDVIVFFVCLLDSNARFGVMWLV